VVVGAIPRLQSGSMAETRQTRQTRQNKKDNQKQDKDELELGLWMLQLHAEGDGNSVRVGGCDICSVVGYYAMVCKLYSKIKMCEYIEAIFGTFMWAAFIATFARKYMR
jgi:hypothetical protein